MPAEMLHSETLILDTISEIGNQAQIRRAKLLLLHAKGLSTREIAQGVDLSPSRVRYWLREYRAGELSVFPSELVERALSKTKEKRLSPPKLKSPGLIPTDPMSEAGRKILRFHFYRMLKNEPGTRLGEDIKALHDMRVATRRMRSAIPIFVPYFEKKILRRFKKDLRKTGRALGRVRDLDVFMKKAQKYIESTEGIDKHELDPLINGWKEEREGSRETMLTYLESDRYKRFVDEFADFLETEGADAIEQSKISPSPYQVFQAVPILIYRRDSVVRGYANIIQDASLETLHTLRIDIKRFRYALEFFIEVLGVGAKSMIAKLVKLQDHLGELNDADVACQILIEFLDQWRKQEGRERVDISGLTHYLVAKQMELRQLVETFPTAWEEYNQPETRQQLAQAVSSL